MAWRCQVGVFRDTTMSNRCRRFHTTFGSGDSKALIRLVARAVAEGRQAAASRTRAGVNTGYGKQVRDRTLLRRRHAGQADERQKQTIRTSVKTAVWVPASWSKRRRKRIRTLAKNAFDNAHCRSFSTLHRLTGLFYTPPEISLRFSMLWSNNGLRRRPEITRLGLPCATQRAFSGL